MHSTLLLLSLSALFSLSSQWSICYETATLINLRKAAVNQWILTSYNLAHFLPIIVFSSKATASFILYSPHLLPQHSLKKSTHRHKFTYRYNRVCLFIYLFYFLHLSLKIKRKLECKWFELMCVSPVA